MGSTDASEDVEPGDRIGRYVVLRRLASGGMAEVYLARQEGPKNFTKLVVIKRVLPGFVKNEKFVEMFLDEGRLAARLSHPNIAQTFELGEHEGGFHLAMEYVPGESLLRLVKRAKSEGKTIPPGAVLRIAVQLLEALDYTHDLKGERGEWLRVVHRDVSPTNVVITYQGGVKLLDFGIARAASHENQTQVGTVKGKGGYMAPEQALAQPVDHRCDIYAVGALLYLLTTGVGPFDEAGDVFAMMRAAVESRFPRPSERNRDIDPQLEQIILKAMSGQADHRFQTAGLMLAELEGCAASQRLFAGSRELAVFMRGLFAERAELALAWDQAPDEGVVDRLAESFADVESDEILAAPTRLARRPKEEVLPSLTPATPAPRLPLPSVAVTAKAAALPVSEKPPLAALPVTAKAPTVPVSDKPPAAPAAAAKAPALTVSDKPAPVAAPPVAKAPAQTVSDKSPPVAPPAVTKAAATIPDKPPLAGPSPSPAKAPALTVSDKPPLAAPVPAVAKTPALTVSDKSPVVAPPVARTPAATVSDKAPPRAPVATPTDRPMVALPLMPRPSTVAEKAAAGRAALPLLSDKPGGGKSDKPVTREAFSLGMEDVTDATVQVHSMPDGIPVDHAGAVPEQEERERRTQQVDSPFAEERTIRGQSVGELPARTVTGEASLPSLPGVTAEPEEATLMNPPPRPRGTGLSAAELIANNPLAFVIAGAGAVLLGVALLWALG